MTSYHTDTRHYATAFTKLAVTALLPEQGKPGIAGFEIWVAIWNNRGRGEVVLGAPTLDALAERWEQITSSDFERDRAQCVVFLSRPQVEVRTDEQPCHHGNKGECKGCAEEYDDAISR